MSQIYNYKIIVPEPASDENGHSQEMGWTRATQTLEATGFARSNWIEYIQPAFVGEEIAVLTWVSNFRRVRSLRKYQFFPLADRQILAKAETNFIFIDLQKNCPRTISENVSIVSR